MRSELLPPTPTTKHPSFLLDPRNTADHNQIAIVIDPGVTFEVPIEGIAIDDSYVLKPEDAMHGSANIIARSIIDLTVLDPELKVMKRLLGQLENGDLPDRVFPDGRREFHYGAEGSVRSITTPFRLTRKGKILSPGPEIRGVSARRFSPGDNNLLNDNEYKMIEDTVHKIAGKPVKTNDRPGNVRANATNTVNHLVNITNAVLSEWSSKHLIPQITSKFHEPLEVSGQILMVNSYVSTTDADIVYGIDTFHAPHTGPGRKRAGFFNLIQVASMLEHGEYAFCEDEAKLYASWLTKIKHERRLKQFLAA